MGQLIDTLRELKIAENTLIVFTGDNGSSFSGKSDIGKRFDQTSNNLRGFKRGMYEGALRQAAIAWWPGTVPAGRVDDQPWAFWDMLPTFVEISGADPAAIEGYETDGFSLVDYLKGGDAPKRDYFYWELHRSDSTVGRAARFGNWKAVKESDKPLEIYDLTTDASELKDLASDRKDLVQQAEAIFAEAHRPDPTWPLTGRTEKQKQIAKEAWRIKKKRDKTGWVPENAIELQH